GREEQVGQMRVRDERDAPRRRPPEPAPAPEEALLLRLQRTAGNHAVAGLLQRNRTGSRDGTRQRARERDAKTERNTAEAQEGVGERDIELAGQYDEDYEAALREFAEATNEMDFSGEGTHPRFDEECWTCVVIGTINGHKRHYRDIPALVKQW